MIIYRPVKSPIPHSPDEYPEVSPGVEYQDTEFDGKFSRLLDEVKRLPSEV
jgi:hypothetical protein